MPPIPFGKQRARSAAPRPARMAAQGWRSAGNAQQGTHRPPPERMPPDTPKEDRAA